MAVSAVVVAVLVAASVAGLSAWLLLTDPAVAADVAAAGDYWPLAAAVMDALGDAFAALLSYL
jgi:hypothetical protein